MFWIIATALLGLVGLGAVCVAVFSDETQEKAGPVLVALTCGVLWIVLSLFKCMHLVGQRQVGIVHNFSGTITGSVNSGLAWTAPWQGVTKENIGIQREDFNLDEANSAVSSDQQAIYAELSLNYQLTPDTIVNLYKTVGPNWKAILLDSRVLQDFKQVASQFSAEEITTKREQLRSRTKELLTAELKLHDISVVDFFVKNLSYTQTYRDAINEKNVQKQLALQAEAKVAQAKAEAEQAVATAKGDATATLVRARADATALSVKGRALEQHPSILKLEAIDKLNPNAQIVFCSTGDCPSFLGSLTGPVGGG